MYERRHQKIFRELDKVTQTLEPVFKARIAAALVYKNEIIALGINSNKTHPLQKRFAIPKYSSPNTERIYKHAEIDCLRQALRNTDDATIQRATMYVYRSKIQDQFSGKSIPALSRPCPGCQSALTAFGISRVCYSTEEGYAWLDD